MKTKNIIIVISLFISFNFFGQTEKGHFLLAGSSDLSISSSTTSIQGLDIETKSTNINFSPVAGYFISDDVSLGLLANFDGTYYDNNNITGFAAGPFLRYYFAKSEKLLPFGQTAVFLGSNSISYGNIEGGTTKISTSIFGYELDLGLGILLSEQVSFDIILGYAHATEDLPVSTIASKKVTTGALGLSLGLSLFLGK